MTQQPMPEAKWLYRRIYTWALTALFCGAVAWIIERAPAADLKEIALRLTWLILVIVTLYLVGPTAEHIVAALRAWKGESR